MTLKKIVVNFPTERKLVSTTAWTNTQHLSEHTTTSWSKNKLQLLKCVVGFVMAVCVCFEQSYYILLTDPGVVQPIVQTGTTAVCKHTRSVLFCIMMNSYI